MLRDSGCMLRVVVVVGLYLLSYLLCCGLRGTVVFVLSSLTSHRFVTGCGFRVTSCGLQVIVVVRLYLLSSLSYFLLLIAHLSPLTSHLFCCGLRVSSYRLPLLSCCLTFYFSLLIAHLSSLTSRRSSLLLRVSSYRLPLSSCCLTFYFSPLTSHLFCCGLWVRNLPYIHHSKLSFYMSFCVIRRADQRTTFHKRKTFPEPLFSV